MPHLVFILAMYFSGCVQTVLNMAHSTRRHSEVSNVKHLDSRSQLFICLPNNPPSQPTGLALRSAAAAVSQVDLLCTTPLKNYMTPCTKKLTGTLKKYNCFKANYWRRNRGFTFSPEVKVYPLIDSDDDDFVQSTETTFAGLYRSM